MRFPFGERSTRPDVSPRRPDRPVRGGDANGRIVPADHLGRPAASREIGFRSNHRWGAETGNRSCKRRRPEARRLIVVGCSRKRIAVEASDLGAAAGDTEGDEHQRDCARRRAPAFRRDGRPHGFPAVTHRPSNGASTFADGNRHASLQWLRQALMRGCRVRLRSGRSVRFDHASPATSGRGPACNEVQAGSDRRAYPSASACDWPARCCLRVELWRKFVANAFNQWKPTKADIDRDCATERSAQFERIGSSQPASLTSPIRPAI
jgi:hypothetical protein